MKASKSISLKTLHHSLGWPTPSDVTNPKGAGASVFSALAREKIGRSLSQFHDGKSAIIGVLMADSGAATSEPPLALVVDFQQSASDYTLSELHRIAWNFSHSPTLITIEPGLLRVWTCCEAPDRTKHIDSYLVHKISSSDLEVEKNLVLENLAARSLHWINLISGQFFSQHSTRFNRDGRADQMLLGNLRDIRDKLRTAGLIDDDVCHDLLARIIFVQFLFDRKDAKGAAALSGPKLGALKAEGILSHIHNNFSSVLTSYSDTYKLFEWLNSRFNGDLFPGKGTTPKERATGWSKEKSVVKAAHLEILSNFIRGDLDMSSGQTCLWPQYSFDIIPLEFISSIYETFVTEHAAQDGIFYTPPHLVDFVLDRVLPWDGKAWDLKVIDPACGSGIFLVKVFQRLVHRWKQANPGKTIRAETLRSLLERNIFGVDKDPHAVRVACFSLYLAMCDEIEPRHYWTQIVFPNMRERRLICSDFFTENRSGFDTVKDENSYDLVVGNAPWGDGLVTQSAKTWAKTDGRSWTVANKDIGGLFLTKAAHLACESGKIAMIQSANSLLFNSSRTANAFRNELFLSHQIEEIYNLSALRFTVFKRKTHTTKTSTAPSCVVILNKSKPSLNDRIAYISPKQLKPLVDEFTIVIEPQDRRFLTVEDAATDPLILTTLMWGGSRDRQLLKKLQRNPSLSAPGEDFLVKSRQGFISGDGKKSNDHLNGRRLFDGKEFPPKSFLYLNANSLSVVHNLKTHSRDSTDVEAFRSPQLILKQSWQKKSGRFQARLVKSKNAEGVLCSSSYISVTGPAVFLEAACLSYNSLVSAYFLQLTSGRMAAYRPATLVHELLALPIPKSIPNMLTELHTIEDVDKCVFDAFELKDAERVLIEDMVKYTIEDFRGDDTTAGKQSTFSPDRKDLHLSAYCKYFIRVLKAGFGEDKAITATIFQSEEVSPIPYRLVGFQLGGPERQDITLTSIKSTSLIAELERLDHLGSNAKEIRTGIYNARIVRIYDASLGVPTIFILKPDMARYWTRSAGLSDGDEVALDLFRWQKTMHKKDAQK